MLKMSLYFPHSLFHHLFRNSKLGTRKIYIVHYIKWNQMDMCMRNFKSYYSNSYSLARNSLLQSLRNFFAEKMQACKHLIINIKNIVYFFFWNYECVANY